MAPHDVLIVGGGVIGCGAALRLCQAGLRVCVIDRGPPGAEASWAAGGILGAHMESDHDGPLLRLALASRALHWKLGAELFELSGIDIGCVQSGVLELAFSDEEALALRKRIAWQRDAGLDARWLEAGEVQRSGATSSTAALGGLWAPEDGRVDNQQLVRALQAAARGAGAEFLRAEVRSLEARGGRVTGLRLVDAGGERLLEADRLVLAAGSWSALLPGTGVPHGAVRPVRGQILAVSAQPAQGAPVLVSGGPLKGYAVPRRDRVLIGSTVEEAGFEKEITPAGQERLRQVCARLCPQLGVGARTPLDRWAGLRPASRDGLPLLGTPAAGPAGLVVATGHYRSGILLAPITAQLVRELVLGEPTSVDLEPFRPDRPALAAPPA